MDASGRSSGGLGEIGSVNGDPIMYDDYQASTAVSSSRSSRVPGRLHQLPAEQGDRGRRVRGGRQPDPDPAGARAPRHHGDGPRDQRGRPVQPARGVHRFQFTDEAGGLDLAALSGLPGRDDPEQLLDPRGLLPGRDPAGQALQADLVGRLPLGRGAVAAVEAIRTRRSRSAMSRWIRRARYDASEFDDLRGRTSRRITTPTRTSSRSRRSPTVKVVVLDKTPTAADTVASEENAAEILQELRDGGELRRPRRDRVRRPGDRRVRWRRARRLPRGTDGPGVRRRHLRGLAPGISSAR